MAATIPVSAQYYTVFNAGPAQAQKACATSMNDTGAVTGYYLDGYNIGHGFFRDAQGNITLFDASSVAFVSTLPKSINASGVIAGNTATQPDGTSTLNGFIRDAQGNITIFDPAGSISTRVAGINASGTIAGLFNNTQGFVRDAQGNITPFQVPGTGDETSITEVAGINDSGAIAGSAVDLFDSGIPFGFIRDPQGNLTRFAVNPAAAQNRIYRY